MAGDLGASSALSTIATLCVGSGVPATMASITTVAGGVVQTTAASHEALVALDRYESPMIEAFQSGAHFTVEDTMAATRWAAFCRECVQLPARSLLVMPLKASSRTLGTMNLFALEPGALQHTALDPIAPVAALASAVLAHEERTAATQRAIVNLEQRLKRREEIEQAKGVLMATMRCSLDRASQTLIEQSQRENSKLHEVATRIVRDATGATNR